MALTGDHMAWQQRVMKETSASNNFFEIDKRSIRSKGGYSTVSSLIDPDVGVSNPNMMRDKKVGEIKAKHNFYIMPTFNKDNLRKHTQQYRKEFDDETLTLYSGGGYIAKSRLGSTYSKKRRNTTHGNRRVAGQSNNKKRRTRRFNEDLDTASQKSIHRRRAFSKTAQKGFQTTAYPGSYHFQQPQLEAEAADTKSKVLQKIEGMTEEEIEKISKQLDQINGKEQPENLNEQDDHDLEAEEIGDQVNDLPEDIRADDKMSVTELSEYGSRQTDNVTRSSQRSSKSYVEKLRRELESERTERKKIELEIEKLKKLSSEISSKLGINIQKK
uniref:Uncharacterized protein n=1 Tax=Euplotes crassus TaxID=5936 RepID=A0A7S3KKS9_EUPCR|mmetsp:Transcript_33049/g.32419  ORF Transcript_33049/g.32419 Transcript_33049/m.32419 type:complete len:329 (+) Transcript_33049:7-993(+)